MNFKTKAIGLLAGSALALSLTTGAMAQTSDTDAQLDPKDGGVCALGDVTSLDADFGTFTWNGTAYTGGQSQTLSVPLTQDTAPTSSCAIDVSASALTNGTGGTISNGAITIDGGDKNNAPLSSTQKVTYADTGVAGTTQSLTLKLTPGATAPTGTYGGTLTISINNG